MRCPWFRHCQSAFVALALAIFVGGGWLLWQQNQRGFQGSWADQIEQKLAEMGLHAEFSSTRLSLSKGLVMHDIRIFEQENQEEILFSADQLLLDIDRQNALRGDWEIRALTFNNGFLRLPQEAEPHHLSALQGSITLDRDHELVLNVSDGKLGAIHFSLETQLQNFRWADDLLQDPKDEEPTWAERITSLQRELSHWTLDSSQLPHLAVKVKGDLRSTTSLETSFTFDAPQLTRESYPMADLKASGSVTKQSLAINELSFRDKVGSFSGRGNFDFAEQEMTFRATADVALGTLLQEGFHSDALSNLTLRDAPEIQARGNIRFHREAPPEVYLTGSLQVADFHYLESDWTSLASDFSWQDGDLYLRDLDVRAPDGRVTGQLLFQNELVRYRAHSTLPLDYYRPFVKEGKPLEKRLDRLSFSKDAQLAVDWRGSIRPSDLTDWSASGKTIMEDFSYNGVPFLAASSTFNLTPLQSIYTDVEVEFDLREDPSHQRFGGPESAVVRADSIVFDTAERTTRVDHLHGVCWPATVLRPFVPEVAKHIEKNFRATQPTPFSSHGLIDWEPGGKDTSFHTQLECPAPLYYDFLGKRIELRDSSALIHSHHRQVDITNFSAYVFSGPLSGNLTVLLPERANAKPDFRGSLMWKRLRLAEIGSRYGFDKVEQGLISEESPESLK
jgi:hypothetical protein